MLGDSDLWGGLKVIIGSFLFWLHHAHGLGLDKAV